MCYIWDLHNFQLISTLQGHTNYLHAVCAMPNTGKACTASEDGTVKIWGML
jgi:WD40 repeat protein